MGWVLKSTSDDWSPPGIGSINSTGMLALWNQESPEFRVCHGDEIVTSNGIHWHHDTKVFNNRIETKWHRTIADAKSTLAMSLHIQRPRAVVEVLESKSFNTNFDVTLLCYNGSTDIGWTLQINTSDPATITDGYSQRWFSQLLERCEPHEEAGCRRSPFRSGQC
ncbi:unnamed protein product [Prorocentrum cordatum]|uniref:Uncharacterized protein n=1 Tax=Prorocentrum cordatum TaxID=2364126 RepID=A0ABN9YDJ0_9DINO|nr:unnamed protein product [Polarella glacialis]